MSFARLSLALIILSSPACSKKQQVTQQGIGTSAEAAPSAQVTPAAPPELSPPLTGTWPAAGTEAVTGYRFSTPDAVESSWSLLTGDKQVDLGTLKKTTVASAQLTPEQTKKLLGCIFGDWKRSGSAACYGPHHLFLFRDATGKITHAIEVCFDCSDVSTFPDLDEKQWNHHDLRGLARLCDQIGIGMVKGTAEDYIRMKDEGEKENVNESESADDSASEDD